MKRRISVLLRSFNNSLTTTRGTLKRSFSSTRKTSPKIKISAPMAALPLPRVQEKHHRRALHMRLLAILTTTIEPLDVMPKTVTLYMSPDFPPWMFDAILSLRILQSIAMVISPPSVSVNPLMRKSAPKPQSIANAFRDARKEAEGEIQRQWDTICRNRIGTSGKEPTAEMKMEDEGYRTSNHGSDVAEGREEVGLSESWNCPV